MSVATKVLIRTLGAGFLFSAFAHAQCPVDTIIVKGRVESANAHAKVRVQLVYPKEKRGESGEVRVSVEDGGFQIPIEFVTGHNSIFSNLPARCKRKPKTIVITLVENDQESDEVHLDLIRDFKMADPSAYTLRSDLVLSGPH